MVKLIDVNMDEFLNTDIESKTKIKDIGKANWAFRKLVDIEMKMKEIEDLAKAELERINNWKKEELKGLQDDKSYFDFQLEQYYREQREIDPSFKLSTPYGKVTSRKQPPSWKYEDEKVIEDLKEKGFMNLVRGELPPLIEVWASWSIFPTEQVYPSSKGRTDLKIQYKNF